MIDLVFTSLVIIVILFFVIGYFIKKNRGQASIQGDGERDARVDEGINQQEKTNSNDREALV